VAQGRPCLAEFTAKKFRDRLIQFQCLHLSEVGSLTKRSFAPALRLPAASLMRSKPSFLATVLSPGERSGRSPIFT
jgi:hypothetical protein